MPVITQDLRVRPLGNYNQDRTFINIKHCIAVIIFGGYADI